MPAEQTPPQDVQEKDREVNAGMVATSVGTSPVRALPHRLMDLHDTSHDEHRPAELDNTDALSRCHHGTLTMECFTVLVKVDRTNYQALVPPSRPNKLVK